MVKMVLKGERPKSMNEFWSGMHYRVRAKYARACHKLVKVEAVTQLGHDFTIDDYPLFAIFIHHRRGRRKIDWDNVVVKPYEDGLVNAGYLTDDNPDYVLGGAKFVVMGAEEDAVEIIYCLPSDASVIIERIMDTYFT